MAGGGDCDGTMMVDMKIGIMDIITPLVAFDVRVKLL